MSRAVRGVSHWIGIAGPPPPPVHQPRCFDLAFCVHNYSEATRDFAFVDAVFCPFLVAYIDDGNTVSPFGRAIFVPVLVKNGKDCAIWHINRHIALVVVVPAVPVLRKIFFYGELCKPKHIEF